ncbi:MAG: MerR family transcriptional regulator [Anaerolineae bacterium]|jgi:DNA-binding transcriptional MerR regulator|nr:MerR family transcriptional regulator [Anaerolineae bacterium]
MRGAGFISSVFHVAPQTVKRWASEFAPYLSADAAPAAGHRRAFNEDDLKVLALVASLKAKGKTFEEIHAALKAGQRGDVPEMPASSPAQTTQALAYYQQEVDDLRGQLQAERTRADKAEGEVAALERVIEKLLSRRHSG